MQVQVSIGANHHFELREAPLVYRDNQTSFITRHEATVQKDAPPTLGPAQPLTVAFVESLVRSLGGTVAAEVLPENILSKGDRMIVWWTPARRRQMFYENSEGKAADLNGRTFPQPPLVWRAANGELSIRALIENKRPEGTTKLAVAPFWNLSAMRHSTAEMTLATYAQTVGDEKTRGRRKGRISCSGKEGECSVVDPDWTHAAYFSLIRPRFSM